MKFKQEGEKLYGKVNYDSITEDGYKVSIGTVFSLTESGAYFDWSLEKCGFGQFSFSCKNGKWEIMNECMGPETSSVIIKAFEDAIRASGDEKAIYCLNKIISLISFKSNSLSKCILLIWNKANTEGGEVQSLEKTLTEYKKETKKEVKVEKNLLFTNENITVEGVEIGSLSTNHYSYSNKQGSFYEATISIFFDIKHVNYGYIYITQRIDLNSGLVEWNVNKGLNDKVLGKVFKALENVEGEHEKIWNIWKNAVKINGGANKMATEILKDAKSINIRYPIK